MALRSLREAVLRAAEADLRAARRYGEVGIAQTHHGLLNLSYERNARVYEVRRFDGSGEVLARGPKRVVLPALIHRSEVCLTSINFNQAKVILSNFVHSLLSVAKKLNDTDSHFLGETL